MFTVLDISEVHNARPSALLLICWKLPEADMPQCSPDTRQTLRLSRVFDHELRVVQDFGIEHHGSARPSTLSPLSGTIQDTLLHGGRAQTNQVSKDPRGPV